MPKFFETVAKNAPEVLEAIEDKWKASPLRWWIRDYNDLPNSQVKLSEHATILHQQAKNVVVFGAITGILCGVIIGALVAVSVEVVSKMGALIEASRSGGLDGFLRAFFGGFSRGSGIAWLVMIVLGTWSGFSWGDRRAFQLRSIATIALSLARIESNLSKSDNENREQMALPFSSENTD